ncbi:MAG: DMT family transporter [Bacteroidales bacterium]|nr:DMT family transporter [Bacteroidales bacterium]
MNEKNRTLLLLHLAVFLAGWTGIFGRVISLDGLPLVWYRVLVALPSLLTVLALSGRLHRSGAGAIGRFAALGILLAMHWVAFYESIQASNVSVGVACIATSCFFSALFEPLLTRSRIQWAELLISFIAIAGILLIFSLDIRYRIGILWGLASAAIYSVFAILNIGAGKRTGEDSATMLLWELAGSVVFLSLCVPVYALAGGEAVPVPQGKDVWGLLVLGSVHTVVPFLLQIHALRRLSAFTVNVAYNLEPVYSILFAALLFGETREVGWSFWAGIALIVLSVWLQTRRVRRRA